MDGWKTRYTFLFGALPGDLFSEQNGILVFLFWGKIMQNINDLIPKTPSVTSPAEVPSDPLKGPHWASLRGLRGSFTWRNMGFPHVVSHILWLHIDAAERHPKKKHGKKLTFTKWQCPCPTSLYYIIQTTPRGCKNRLTTELTWPQSSPLLARRRKDWLLPPHWRPRSYEGDATSNLGGGG